MSVFHQTLCWMTQEAAPPTDFWSRLLGIDRVKLGDGELSLAWQHMPPAWVIFLIIVPAALLMASLIYRKERRDVGVAPKVILSGLRALLLLVIVFLLMGPVLTVETIKMHRAFIIVLIDESRSMQKVDLLQTATEREGVAKVTGVDSETDLRQLTRADVVRKVLENPKLKILDELEKKLNVAYFTFSNVASAKEDRKKFFEDYRKDTCIGTETAIGDAIKASLNTLRGQYIAGVVVVSDGKNNAGMSTGEIAKQLKQRYLPIYTVAAGVPHAPKDIQLLELEALEAGLANDDAKLTFKISSLGYENENVSVGLWIYPLKEKDKDLGQDPKELDRLIEEARKETDQSVILSGNQKQTVNMVFNPKTPGEFLLILRVDPRAEENTAHNNYLTHRFTVADDKIKVLYVEDPPRYEYRFLKNALIRDPKILAHCLLVSADSGFPQEHTKTSEDKLFSQPLQEFPKELKELLNYDVILYGDVEPGKLGPDAAKNIETFVSEFGGGIVFISGTRSNPRSLANTPLANLLPIVPDENKDLYEHEKIYARHLDYQLTPDGRTSIITNFKDFKGDRDKNQEHWEDRAPPKDGLIGIRWFTRIKKLKAGASPLVELVGVEGETSRPPLFVTQHVGRGRVFWSATDETWLWRRLTGDYPWFYPFWQQAMYWTRQGKLLGARRYRVSVDRERYTRGERVNVFVNAWDEKFQLKTDRQIEVFVDPPAGRAGLDRIKVPLYKDSTRDGYYEGSYQPDDIGLYRIWAGEEDEATRASAKFTVFIPDREDDEPVLDEKTLRELAGESYGGQYFPISEVDKLNTVIQKSENQLRELKEDDLWDSPLVYLVFALLITAEWILRKVFRML